jgi:co-chaperonin GroES (HSP10)
MIRPTAYRILLQKVKEEEPAKGGLILKLNVPDQERYKVVELCDTIKTVTKGLIVFVDKYKGVEIKDGDQTYLCVEEPDIVAYRVPEEVKD